jgi:ketopantoate reductase
VEKHHDLAEEICDEIARVVGRHVVLTFVDARKAHVRVVFLDPGQLSKNAHKQAHSDQVHRLEQLFARFRLAVRTQPDSPLWMCALHIFCGTKRAMFAFYDGDYPSELSTSELMDRVVQDHLEYLDRMKCESP